LGRERPLSESSNWFGQVGSMNQESPRFIGGSVKMAGERGEARIFIGNQKSIE
jgi:hypothetical protein